MAAIDRTWIRIRAMGKKVVLVQPPPVGGFDVAECLERRLSGKLVLGKGITRDPSVFAWRRIDG